MWWRWAIPAGCCGPSPTTTGNTTSDSIPSTRRFCGNPTNKYPPAEPGVLHRRVKPWNTSARVTSRWYGLPAAKDCYLPPVNELFRSFPLSAVRLPGLLLTGAGCILLSFYRFLGQFTRNYTQTVKRAADNKRRYAPGWVHSTCLLRGFPKGAAPHLAHDFAEQSVVCYTLCRRCPENTVAAGEGKGI